jgi:hypothetical protein
MAAYVLWAMQYYRMRPDDIRTELIFLKTGKVTPYSFFWEQLSELQEMIPKEFAAMMHRMIRGFPRPGLHHGSV